MASVLFAELEQLEQLVDEVPEGDREGAIALLRRSRELLTPLVAAAAPPSPTIDSLFASIHARIDALDSADRDAVLGGVEGERLRAAERAAAARRVDEVHADLRSNDVDTDVATAIITTRLRVSIDTARCSAVSTHAVALNALLVAEHGELVLDVFGERVAAAAEAPPPVHRLCATLVRINIHTAAPVLDLITLLVDPSRVRRLAVIRGVASEVDSFARSAAEWTALRSILCNFNAHTAFRGLSDSTVAACSVHLMDSPRWREPFDESTARLARLARLLRLETRKQGVAFVVALAELGELAVVAPRLVVANHTVRASADTLALAQARFRETRSRDAWMRRYFPEFTDE